ncbi:nucleotidyl transferase AbiEii/AbiGii toxin family protein [Candidatus Bathyarchaeota archaeon]|nr:nucleotidyl transferase AbiEii/AbiGii toxin family protein [Candidatus Bathyarchaeota archaeon]
MYARQMTEASKSALLEIGLELKSYRNDMVLSGGWAPYFITKEYFEHCGSIDIDLVLRTKIMKKYETIKKSILRLGYIEENPFRFSRTVKSPIDGKDYGVHIDFLCDKEGMKYVDLKHVQEDLQAFSFEGLNIAFEFNFEQEIETILPNNGEAKTRFRVIDLVGSLALKGQALDGRAKPKDSYDIYALMHYGGGPEKAAEYFNNTTSRQRLSPETKKLLKRSLLVVTEKFKNENQIGPFQVENFSEEKIKRNIVSIEVNRFLTLIRI